MNYRRSKQAGGTYFFTLVTHNRQAILTLPENIARLRTAFKHEMDKNPFTLEAIVILPDHLHCLWTLPPDDDDYSTRWSRIKSYFSTGCTHSHAAIPTSRMKKREKAVWQRRFWEHTIRDENDWNQHLDYIHYNPVKHGLAAAPKDWAYGSFQQCVKKGWYESNWGATIPPSIHDLDFE